MVTLESWEQVPSVLYRDEHGSSRMCLGPVPCWGCGMSHSTTLMVAVLATLAQDTSWIAEFIDTLGVIVTHHNFYGG